MNRIGGSAQRSRAQVAPRAAAAKARKPRRQAARKRSDAADTPAPEELAKSSAVSTSSNGSKPPASNGTQPVPVPVVQPVSASVEAAKPAVPAPQPVVAAAKEVKPPAPAPQPTVAAVKEDKQPAPAPQPVVVPVVAKQEPAPAPQPVSAPVVAKQEPAPAPQPASAPVVAKREPVPPPEPLPASSEGEEEEEEEEEEASISPSADIVSAPFTTVGREDAAVARAALQPEQQLIGVAPADPNEATFRAEGNANRLRLKDFLQADGGPPRFICPFVPGHRTGSDVADLPLCFYLPGIDGTGLAASRQFPYLVRAFDLRCFSVPGHDRTDFQGLVDIILEYVAGEVADCPVERPVYLLGESFGGVLALAVAAARPDLVDRIVLVNPATSFQRSPWPALGPLLPQVPKELYNSVPVALAPVLGNPLALASFGIDRKASLPDQARAFAAGLQALLPQLQSIAEILPPPTLAWKLKLLDEGNRLIAGKEKEVNQRVLLVVGDRDLLIPSKEEGDRLRKALPRAALRVLPGRSHALLQEAGVDLVKILQEEGFYVRRRTLSAPLKERGRASFGAAAPIELPTARELDRYCEGLQDNIRKATSPVFFSRDAEGRLQQGLGFIPEGRPLLFVGNHQTLAVDLGVMVEQIIRERGILPRGLAHPAIFAGQGGTAGGPQSPLNNNETFSSFMSTFGAVPVGARNFFRLLQNGEAVLLYPGGVREAYKRKGEEYRLFWPERAEFVRMAAKYGATIVPFAGVGAEDSIRLVADSAEIQRIPVLGQQALRRAQQEIPPARRGVALGDEPDLFIAPLALPQAPERFYFLFQPPIETRPEDAKDRGRTAELYQQVKGSVEEGIAWLRKQRERDPYRHWFPRWAYEVTWGGKQAPTFPLR